MPTSVIPPPLLARLQQLRPLLVRQGIVQMRTGPDRRPSFRLRYRACDEELGAERHYSIALPDQAVAEAVATLINAWREEHAAEERNKKALREQEEAEAAEYRQMVGAVVALNGGKRRMRDRALKSLKEAAEAGPWELLKFGASDDWLRPGKPGRPPRRRYS